MGHGGDRIAGRPPRLAQSRTACCAVAPAASSLAQAVLKWNAQGSRSKDYGESEAATPLDLEPVGSVRFATTSNRTSR